MKRDSFLVRPTCSAAVVAVDAYSARSFARHSAFNISVKTSDGRRATFCFMNYGDGAARFVDIQFHGRGSTIPNANGGKSPTFNSFCITKGGRHIVDTRALTEDIKPSIMVLLLDTIEEEEARAVGPAGGSKL